MFGIIHQQCHIYVEFSLWEDFFLTLIDLMDIELATLSISSWVSLVVVFFKEHIHSSTGEIYWHKVVCNFYYHIFNSYRINFNFTLYSW